MATTNLLLIGGFLLLVSICQVMPGNGAVHDYGPIINDAQDSVQQFKYKKHADAKNDDNDEYEDDDDDDDDDEDDNGEKEDIENGSDDEGGAQEGKGTNESSDKSESK